jgi:TonB-dependent SusC/RagA subfamily outer membrane receptor
MTAIAYYLLKMLICSGMLTGYYYACLQNKLFHQWNRFYLLFTVIVSMVFPLLHIPLFDFSSQANAVENIAYTITASELAMLKRQSTSLSTTEWVTYTVYGGVTVFFFVVFAISLYRINRLKKRSAFIQESDINIYQTNASQAPFSFFKNIFWKQSIDLQSADGKRILKHELVHVYERHSVDKVLMQVVLGIFWINPFFWLIKKELTMIHEFIADKKSVEGNDASALASLILTTAYSSGRFNITNQFFQSSIKRRITMISENKDPRFSYLRRIAALFLLLTTFGMLAFRSKNVNEAHNLKHPPADTVPKLDAPKPDAVGFYVTEQHKGGSEKLVSVVPNSKTDKPGSPLNIRKALYIVDGKELTQKDIDGFNPETIESIHVWKDSSALKKYGAKGKNGVVIIETKKTANPNNVKDVLLDPVPDKAPNADATKHSLTVPDKVADTTPAIRKLNSNISIVTPELIVMGNKDDGGRTFNPSNALWIVDGKEITEKDLNFIKASSIQSMSIWKDAKAIERYGEKGKNGVIEIETKKPAKPALVP